MLQASTVQVPVLSPPPVPGATTVSSRVLNPVPMSAQEVASLKARREALSDQLISADGRRKELSRRARSATGADKAGLEQRIGVLDARLARLETDIDETGKLLASTPAALASTRGGPSIRFANRLGDNMLNTIPIVAILSVFVFFPIAIAIARNIWRRGSLPRATGPDRESAQRLERMEQAMEAIAIEIERVSEGQRFVTRLMSEQRDGRAAVGGGEVAEPLRVGASDKARA